MSETPQFVSALAHLRRGDQDGLCYIASMTGATERFGTFLLQGPRFNPRGVPVEALAELVAYREIIIDVARQLYLREHPSRERSLRGLDKMLDLRLLEVGEGSANLMLTRLVPTDTLGDEAGRPIADLFEASRDLVTETITKVDADFELPSAFPRKALPKFRALGRSLTVADTLTVGDLGINQAKYTDRTRARFLDLIADDSRSVHQEIAGRIVELDPERFIFHLRTSEDNRIQSQYGASGLTIPHDWLVNEYGRGPLVTVVGAALVSDDGEVQKFLSVDEVQPAGHAALVAKVDRLADLPPGWMGVESVAIRPEAIAFVRDTLRLLRDVPAGLSPAPLPDGGIRFEWTRDGVEYVAEVEADGNLYLCIIGPTPADDHDLEFGSWDAEAFIGFIDGVVP